MNDQLLISKVKNLPLEKGVPESARGRDLKNPPSRCPSGHPFFQRGIKILVVIVIITYLAPSVVLALDYVPLAPLPVGEGGASLTRVTDAGQYIKGAFNLAIGIAAVLAIIMIVFGGIQYMGTESIGGKGAGLKKIKDAVLGLLLALGSYIILLTINPDLVNFSVSIARIEPPSTTLAPIPPDNLAVLGSKIRKVAIDTTKAAEKAFAEGNTAEGNRLLAIAEEMHTEDLKLAGFDSRMTTIQRALDSGNLGGAQTVLPGLNSDIDTEQQRLTNLANNTANADEKARLLSLVSQLETLQTNFTNSATQQINSGSYYFSYLERGANGNDILRSAGPFLSPELCQTAWEEISNRITSLDPPPGGIVRMVGICNKK